MDKMHPWYDVVTRVLHSLQKFKTKSNHDKTSNKLKLKEILQNNWSVLVNSKKT